MVEHSPRAPRPDRVTGSRPASFVNYRRGLLMSLLAFGRSEEHTSELQSPVFPYTTLFRSSSGAGPEEDAFCINSRQFNSRAVAVGRAGNRAATWLSTALGRPGPIV